MLGMLRRRARSFADSWLATPRGSRFVLRAVAAHNKFVFADFGDHSLVFDGSEFIGRNLFWNGQWQRKSTEAAISFTADVMGPDWSGAFLEFGANIGSQTVYAALSGQFSRFIAVEPDPNNLSLLETNIRLNSMTDRTTVCRVAVSDASGAAKLQRVQSNSGCSTLRETSQPVNEGGSQVREVEVPVVRADDLLSDLNILPTDVAMVWIDVEGLERQVLRGMPRILAARVPLHIEYTPFWMTPQERKEFVELLSGYGQLLVSGEAFTPIDPEGLLAIDTQIDVLALPRQI